MIEKTCNGNKMALFVSGWLSIVDGLIQVVSLGRLSGEFTFSARYYWDWFEALEDYFKE